MWSYWIPQTYISMVLEWYPNVIRWCNTKPISNPQFQVLFLFLKVILTFQIFSLNKPNYSYSDVGLYKCEITQRCRDGSFQTISTIPSRVILENCAPFVVMEPQNCRIEAGESLELKCRIEGNPIPDFQWYKDDFPLYKEVSCSLQVIKIMTYCLPNSIFFEAYHYYVNR